jgi:arginine-tRNA-protein transferase
MISLSEQFTTNQSSCPYLHDRLCRFEIFYAVELSAAELDSLVASGWRTFGPQYFKPSCDCRECIPVRVLAQKFIPSKSQRRLLRKNSDIETRIVPLEFRPEIYDIYADHSLSRFGKSESLDTFLEQFYLPSCPAMQSEFYLDGVCVAVGFINISANGVSSVYFIYRESVLDRGIGILSIIREIEFAREQGLEYYYPGYYIKENRHMNYKNRFHPNQYYSWEQGIWIDEANFNG